MNAKPLRKTLEQTFLGLLSHQDDECLTVRQVLCHLFSLILMSLTLNISQQIALSLSLLPESEESWKNLIAHLIEQVHIVLDTVYNGLEDVDHQEQYGEYFLIRSSVYDKRSHEASHRSYEDCCGI